MTRDRRNPWIGLPLKEKRERTVRRYHAPPCDCLVCGTRLMPRDRSSHRERCEGRPEPHRLDLWEPHSVTRARGLPESVLGRAVESGAIRSREHDGERELLTRDVEQLTDALELFGLGDG